MKELKSYEPFLSQIMLAIAKDTRFSSEPPLAEVIANNPKLVIVFNHSSPLSWLPAISLLCAHVCARGGGQRRPIGVMDRIFFELPIVKNLAGLLTQTDKALSFPELTSSFVDGDATDLVVFPEGSNCFFGDPAELKPFRSPRFVELAIKANAPIYICLHRGSESWGMAVPVPQDWMDKISALPKMAADFLSARIKSTGLFTLPLWPSKMDKFEMKCWLYHPTLKASDLADDREERNRQIQEEADKIRAFMEQHSLANPTIEASTQAVGESDRNS